MWFAFWVVVAAGVVAFVASALRSPAVVMPRALFDRPCKNGNAWTSVGLEAQRWWWARVGAAGVVWAAFALLFFLAATNVGAP